MMENNEILNKILSNYKKIVAFYPYPTGGAGESNKIVEINDHHTDERSLLIRNFITSTIQLGAAAGGFSNDNKIAVKVNVPELNFPIYFVKYDSSYYITKEINFSRSREIKVNWNVEN